VAVLYVFVLVASDSPCLATSYSVCCRNIFASNSLYVQMTEGGRSDVASRYVGHPLSSGRRRGRGDICSCGNKAHARDVTPIYTTQPLL
jgi:hypothetical protein